MVEDDYSSTLTLLLSRIRGFLAVLYLVLLVGSRSCVSVSRSLQNDLCFVCWLSGQQNSGSLSSRQSAKRASV